MGRSATRNLRQGPDAGLHADTLSRAGIDSDSWILAARRTLLEIQSWRPSGSANTNRLPPRARAAAFGRVAEASRPGRNGHVLAAVDGVGDRVAHRRGANVDFPQHLAGLVIEGAEVSKRVAAEDQAAARGDDGVGPTLRLRTATSFRP